MVRFAVFDKVCARFHKAKPDIKINAFIVQRFDPFIMQRAGAVVVFSAGDDLLDLAGRQIFFLN